MKVIREKELEMCDNMTIKYGTAQRANPEVIYVTSKFWILPRMEMNFENVMNEIKNDFQMLLTSIIKHNTLWHNKFISDFDIKFNGLQPNKKSFVSIEFYIKQKSEMMRQFKSLEDDIVHDFKPLFQNLKENLSDYNFTVNKTR